jgi:hypothetical protein
METYSRIRLLRSYGNLQSYWTTTKPWKLIVVLDFHEAMETYSRIGLLRSHGNLQSYWTTEKLWKLTVVLNLLFVHIRNHQLYCSHTVTDHRNIRR